MRHSTSLLLTCEHGGHRVPAAWAELFRGRERLLRSHRGWDPGALSVARALARASGAPLVASTTTRLLVDLNRSPHNPAVFSELTRGLAREERARLLRHHHAPHWDRVRAALRAGRRPVLHLAVHSFTPRLAGERRDFDVGLLYDPSRPAESRLAARWRGELLGAGGLCVRRNAPYRGDADGLTTALRRERSASHYRGLELELSQALLARPRLRRRLVGLLARSLLRVLSARI